jgi:hypothetical protein
MANSATYDLLIYGRAAAKSGEASEARRYLERMLYMDPPQEERLEALYWLSEVSSDPKEQRSLLEEILANNFGDARARRKLAILDGKIKPEEIVDPDRMPAPKPDPSNPRAVQAQAFNCPKCGGRMTFAPDGQALLCEYCEAQEHISAPAAAGSPGKGPQDDFFVAMITAKAHSRPVSMQSVACRGCGAVFVLPPEEITQGCPYCNTPYAVEQIEVRTLDAPDGVLPFSVTAEEAHGILRDWLAKNPPQGHLKLSRPGAIYLPAWLFNLGGQIHWDGWIYKNDTRVAVSGTQIVGRDNLLVPASTHLPEKLGKAWQGFNLNAVQPYDPRYLAGIPAETFGIPAADASLKAREQALQLEKRDILLNEQGRRIEGFAMHTPNMLVESYRLILLPVWKAFYLLDGERFHVAVNGQTGAVTGERPEKGLFGWVKDLF